MGSYPHSHGFAFSVYILMKESQKAVEMRRVARVARVVVLVVVVVVLMLMIIK